jgi:hypothetical protein
MRRAKTELSFVAEAIEVARNAGFLELSENSQLEPGARKFLSAWPLWIGHFASSGRGLSHHDDPP